MKITMTLATLDLAESPTVTDFCASALLERLVHAKLIRSRDWGQLPVKTYAHLRAHANAGDLTASLVALKLLTPYQAERVRQGGTDELILGNYCILDFLGAGAVGTVYKAEHHLLRRPVAIKVVAVSANQAPLLLDRFLNEIWVLGQLQHPNIVAALDAGDLPAANADAGARYYIVMEYLPGQNLETLVKEHGPLEPVRACELIHQITGALAEAHRHHLVHRDIKPSNVGVTPDGQAKLLDFGLTRIADRRLTEVGTVLGSLAYLAPEQARNANGVDIRADIYGLGGTLYWALTGQTPFTPHTNAAVELAQRQQQPPPRIRAVRPDISPELETLIASLLATRPEDRPPTPEAVQHALLPFLRTNSPSPSLRRPFGDAGPARKKTAPRLLIVDDEPSNRDLCRIVLEAIGLTCDEAENGKTAMERVRTCPYDLIVLDIDMPVMNGVEVLQRLRAAPPAPHLKIIMVSGRLSSDEMARMLATGADDYLTKPFSVTQIQARVKAALTLKSAQERSDALFSSLLTVNQQLESNLSLRDSDLVHARNALVLALAELVAHRDTETGAHLLRLQRYCRCLAEKAASCPSFAGAIDENFVAMLECCAPLHDIGKAGVPDHILLKPGRFTPEEMLIMQTHTTIGADILDKVAKRHGFAKAFLKMATDITRSHHERFDGRGYPDRLVGEAIPLSARLVAIGDVYDAMRSRRVYKPALPHDEVLGVMLHQSPGHFDPALLAVFEQCADRFDELYSELVD